MTICLLIAKHSCPTALLALTEDWRAELDKHKIIGTVAIDLSKALDCLPHDLLLEKLNFYGREKIPFYSYVVIYPTDINGLSWGILSPRGWVCIPEYHKGHY